MAYQAELEEELIAKLVTKMWLRDLHSHRPLPSPPLICCPGHRQSNGPGGPTRESQVFKPHQDTSRDIEDLLDTPVVPQGLFGSAVA